MVVLWDLMGFNGTLPSGYVKIAIENDHRNSGFTHEKWLDFPVRYVTVYQAGYLILVTRFGAEKDAVRCCQETQFFSELCE